MELNYDFGTMTLGAPPALNPPLYASIDGRVASLGGDEVTFYDPLLDRSHVMTVQVLQAMDLCREFQPMDAHVQRVSDTLPGMKGQHAAVRRVLEGLASRGLLMNDDAWLQRFESVPALSPAPLAAIFIRACNRPAQLRTLLASLLEHDRRFGLPADVVLVDDSTDSAAIAAHREAITAFGSEASVAGRYVGQDAWAAIIRTLSAQLPEAAIGALLQRPTAYHGRRGGGVGKNLISLLAAGRRYLLLDDDFLFPLRRHPEAAAGLALGEQGWAIRSFASQEAAFAAGREIDGDPLQHHLALCGQAIGPLLMQVPELKLDRGQLRGLAPSRLPLLDPQRRVMLTTNGHHGQSGASGIAWLYLLDPAARAGLCANAEAYVALRGDPPVWWGCNRHQLGTGGNFTPFAVDNARLLPPTSPFGRGEDALFSALCGVAYADMAQLDVPFAIGHRQEGARDRTPLLAAAETPDINHCLAELARHVAGDLYADGPVKRLGVFAARLEDLAGGSDSAVLAYLGEFLAYRRSTLIEQLQQVLKVSKDMPAPWQQDVAAQIHANGRSLIERAAPRFSGWPEDAPRADYAQAFRREAGVLIDGLRAWPAAWDIAVAESADWLHAAT